MDEIVLVKECLSDSKLKTGKDLLEKLDASGISIELRIGFIRTKHTTGAYTLLHQR